MKKITFKVFAVIAMLANGAVFAQGTGNQDTSSDAPIGIQNNFGVEDSRNAQMASVLIAGAPGNPDWILDVEAKLDDTGLVAADTFLTSTGTPTLAELQSYDAVLIFTDAGAADPIGFGDNLAQYIEGGGAVVDATFTANVPITGGFTTYALYSDSGQSNGTNLGLGTINDPTHPILADVTSFDGGTASFHNTGGTIAGGATVIAEYSTAAPFIIIEENVGPASARRAFLNFYPPSIDARDDFWDTASDGATIMANALNWASFNATNADVLVLGAPGDESWILDVEAKIEETGGPTGDLIADTFLINNETPTLTQLQQYEAVFVFTDAGAADPAALGDALASYIESGGHVVDATFTPNVDITGGFTQYQLYSNSGQSGGTNLGIDTILDPANPVLTSVSTFDGGTSSFHNTGGTIAPGATIVAEYADSSPFILVEENVGPANSRRVFLNFYPPSIDVRDDFWDTSSDGALIMRNALIWAIDGEVLSADDNTISDVDISIYPNPAQDQLTISNNSGVTIERSQIIDITGRVVQSINLDDTTNTVDISQLSAGVYLLRMENSTASNVIRFIKK